MRDVDYKTEQFELNELQVHHVMQDKLVTCSNTANCRSVADIMLEYENSFVPIVDESDEYVGFITDSDLTEMIQSGKDLDHEIISRHIHNKPGPLMPDTPINQAFKIFEDKNVQRIPVTSCNRLRGTVSRNDLIDAAIKSHATYYNL